MTTFIINPIPAYKALSMAETLVPLTCTGQSLNYNYEDCVSHGDEPLSFRFDALTGIYLLHLSMTFV